MRNNIMKRKLIRLAEKTLVISLPNQWVESQGLNKGDEVDISIDDFKLVVHPPQKILPHQETTIDVKDMAERVLRWNISSLHKKGFDEITIINYNSKQEQIIRDLIRDLFIGFIIKEKSSMRIVVGQIAEIDVKEFDTTLRRAFRHLNEMVKELSLAFEKEDSELLKNQIQHEFTNNKLTNFCERLLNKNLKEKSLGHFWYVIAWNLEKIADNFKYIAESYEGKPKISSESLQLLKEVMIYLEKYSTLLYEFKIETLVDLSKQKKVLEKNILEQMISKDDKFKDDKIFLHYLHIVVLQLADFSASMIALKT